MDTDSFFFSVIPMLCQHFLCSGKKLKIHEVGNYHKDLRFLTYIQKNGIIYQIKAINN